MTKAPFIIAAATLALGLSSGAVANAKEVSKDKVMAEAAPQIQPNVRICVKQLPTTGSIATTTTCRTAAQWQKEGVNPSDLLAKKKND